MSSLLRKEKYSALFGTKILKCHRPLLVCVCKWVFELLVALTTHLSRRQERLWLITLKSF